MQQIKVGVLLGSLRQGSYSSQLARALAQAASPSLQFTSIEIGDLPLYNQDLETDAPPAAWTRFRQQVAAVDALLFVTPEYNRTVPAALKNAVDVGSRPWGQSIWNDKPALVVGQSPGALGGIAASQHLRLSLAALNVPVLGQPEAYVSNVASLFDAQGELNNEQTREYCVQLMLAFETWARRLSR